jgi:hypothetical protein
VITVPTTSEPLADDYLAAIQARHDALRPMTWQIGRMNGDGVPNGFGPFSWVEAWDHAQLIPAIHFCNSARVDIPALLGEIARLRAEPATALMPEPHRPGATMEDPQLLAARENVRELRATLESLIADPRAALLLDGYRDALHTVQAAGLAAADRTDYRAWHDSSGINLGHYTGREAAMSHVYAVLATEEGTTAEEIAQRVIWRADDPNADNTTWECWLLGPDGEDDKPTGYVVTPVPVAAAYDPEADS